MSRKENGLTYFAKYLILILLNIVIDTEVKSQNQYSMSELLDLIDVCTDSIQSNKNPQSYLEARASAYYNLGQYNEAIKDILSYIKFDSTNAEIFYVLAIAYSEINNYGKCKFYLSKAIDISPEARYYISRGLINENLKLYAEALSDFTEAIGLNDAEAVSALTLRAFLFQEMNDYENALIDLNKILEICPDSAVFYDDRGMLYLKMGKYTQAVHDFAKAQNLSKNFKKQHMYNYHLGYALALNGSFNSAFFYFETGNLGEQNDPQFYYYRGLSRQLNGNIELACEDINKAMNLGLVISDEVSSWCK